MRRFGFAALAVLVATPATAYHCPHGQLWRIRLGKCVSLSSPLAFAYEGRRYADSKVWYVEVTKEPPVADRRSPKDIVDQAEHDAAVQAYKAELNAKLAVIRAQEDGAAILKDLFRRGE